MSAVDVDRVWTALGSFGRYQKTQMALFVYSMIAVAYSILVFVFAAYRPNYLCKLPPTNNESLLGYTNSSEIQVVPHSCDIKVVRNTSGESVVLHTWSCDSGYEYDLKPLTIVSQWDLVCSEEGKGEFTQSAVTIGQTVSAFLVLPLADKYGRKRVFVYNGLLLFLSMTLISLSPNFYVYSAMKFLMGFSLEAHGMTMYTYVFEMFPRKERSYLVIMGSFLWSFNVMGITIFGYGLQDYSWRYLHLATGLAATGLLFFHWFTDESLRWLIANGSKKEAILLVKKIATKNKTSADEAIQLIFPGHLQNHHDGFQNEQKKAMLAKEENSKPEQVGMISQIKTIFKHNYLRSITIIWFITWFTNSVTYYGLLLSSVQIKGSRFLNYFINGAMELPANVVFFLVLNRISRRTLVVGFHLLAGIPMVIAAVLLTFKDTNPSLETIAVICGYIAKVGITGSYNSIFIHTPETYPTNYRNIGIGLSSAASHVGGIIAPFSTLLAVHVVWGPSVIFGAFCVVVSALLYGYMPDTRKRNLPQTIEEMELWTKTMNSK